jgi:hypothetical protein
MERNAEAGEWDGPSFHEAAGYRRGLLRAAEMAEAKAGVESDAAARELWALARDYRASAGEG